MICRVIAALVFRVEPVPAFAHVGAGRLGRVGDQEPTGLRQLIHPGAGREVIRILAAAVQHHHQRHRLALVGLRDEQLIGAPAGGVGEASGLEPGGLRRPLADQPVDQPLQGRRLPARRLRKRRLRARRLRKRRLRDRRRGGWPDSAAQHRNGRFQLAGAGQPQRFEHRGAVRHGHSKNPDGPG
jgi:hypothetical protein